MDIKDWIQIIIEVIVNGIILVFFAKWLDFKMRKAERKEESHSSVVQDFYNQLVNVNKSLIRTNYNVLFNKITDANIIWKMLEDFVLPQVVEVVVLYDTYEYELEKYKIKYDDFINAWSEFTQQTTPRELGIKLEEFKKKTKILINAISKRK